MEKEEGFLMYLGATLVSSEGQDMIFFMYDLLPSPVVFIVFCFLFHTFLRVHIWQEPV